MPANEVGVARSRDTVAALAGVNTRLLAHAGEVAGLAAEVEVAGNATGTDGQAQAAIPFDISRAVRFVNDRERTRLDVDPVADHLYVAQFHGVGGGDRNGAAGEARSARQVDRSDHQLSQPFHFYRNICRRIDFRHVSVGTKHRLDR